MKKIRGGCQIIGLLIFLLTLSTAWSRNSYVASALSAAVITIQKKEATSRNEAAMAQRPAISRRPAIRKPNNPIVVRPGELLPRPQVAKVQLAVNRNPVQIGEQVKFTLAPANLVLNSPFSFTFAFGDGTQYETHQAEIVHRYRTAASYTVSVSVQNPTGVKIFQPIPQVGNTLTLQVDRVSLSAPTTVEVLEEVSFETSSLSGDPSIRYRFVFGDDSPRGEWLERPTTTHRYSSVGTYAAEVDIGLANRKSIEPIDSSIPRPIEVKALPPRAVDFSVIPTSVEAEQPASFQARLVSRDPTILRYTNIRYRFVFGDGSPPSAWEDNGQKNYRYSAARTYAPYAEIGLVKNGAIITIATSATKQISVTPPPRGSVTPTPRRSVTSSTPNVAWTHPDNGGSTDSSGNWWPYTIAALIVLSVGTLLVRQRARKGRFSARPTFHPYPDPGVSHLTEGREALGIDFQVLLNPNLAEGQYRLDTLEASLIRSVRRKNG